MGLVHSERRTHANQNLSAAQFKDLKPGDHFRLPGHDGEMTLISNDSRAGKSRLMYQAGRDPQPYGYSAPSLGSVSMA